MDSEPRILVIIPAHNEAASIGEVIADIRASLAADIVVVDDGSSDGTARIARDAGVEVLQLPFNLGIGSTMQTGYKFARREGYDIAVQTDGDGQHKAAHIKELLAPIIAGESDMVVGSRYLSPESYKGPFGRRAGTALFSWVLSVLLRQRLTDATSGFRAVNRELIELFARDYPGDYPEVEALLTAHMARLRVREVPVAMRPRGGGRSSITNFHSVYYMVKVFLALMVVISRRRAPRSGQEVTPR